MNLAIPESSQGDVPAQRSHSNGFRLIGLARSAFTSFVRVWSIVHGRTHPMLPVEIHPSSANSQPILLNVLGNKNTSMFDIGLDGLQEPRRVGGSKKTPN